MTDTDADWTCSSAYRHPKFVRSLALQLWGLKCSRDFNCTRAALLATAVESGLSCVPDIRTLRQWAASEDWSGEVARMMRSIAPDIMGGLVVDLIMAASEGMPWLRSVLSGEVDKPNTARVRAILTALSMVGVPDLAHQAMRESAASEAWLDGGDTSTRAITENASIPTDMGSWKSGIAQRLGHMDTP